NKLPADRGKVGEGQGTQESTRRESAKENIRDVLPYDSVPLDIVLADDVGVERPELEYRINQGMAQLEGMPLDRAEGFQASRRCLCHRADGGVKEGDAVR